MLRERLPNPVLFWAKSVAVGRILYHVYMLLHMCSRQGDSYLLSTFSIDAVYDRRVVQ
jgi:hypothetical protein